MKVSDSINSFIFKNNTRSVIYSDNKHSKSSKIENENDEEILLYGSRDTITEQSAIKQVEVERFKQEISEEGASIQAKE